MRRQHNEPFTEHILISVGICVRPRLHVSSAQLRMMAMALAALLPPARPRFAGHKSDSDEADVDIYFFQSFLENNLC